MVSPETASDLPTGNFFWPVADAVSEYMRLAMIRVKGHRTKRTDAINRFIFDFARGEPSMSVADSFSKLFRRSNWARFDPALKRVYLPASIDPPSRPSSMSRMAYSERPKHFGFKRDMPERFFRKPVEKVTMRTLDGEFGQAQFHHADLEYKHYYVLKELQEAMASGSRVPARFLNKTTSDGYAMGVAGFVGHLPVSEAAEGFKFTLQDVLTRRAYWLWIKQIVVEGQVAGRPYIVFTMRPSSAKIS